eukprot:m.356417 g.356417  ORF g.356417 m.356417 type:complete len:249 (-) comp20753_c0_seq3:507-1253(-)
MSIHCMTFKTTKGPFACGDVRCQKSTWLGTCCDRDSVYLLLPSPYVDLLSLYGGSSYRYTVLWMIVLVFSYLGCMALVFLSLPDSDSVRRQPKNYEEGYYFAFVTFSTIGFGDYFIGDDNLGYTVLQLFTIFMGLAVLSALIAILQQTLHKIIAKADYIIISMAEEEEYDDDTVLINAERQDISEMHMPIENTDTNPAAVSDLKRGSVLHVPNSKHQGEPSLEDAGDMDWLFQQDVLPKKYGSNEQYQ